MIQTLALAAIVLFAGYGIRKRVGVLDRFNIPAPVVGGFLFAALTLALRQSGVLAFEFTTTLQSPMMVAFFTTIGLGASFGLLRIGGWQVVLFWGLASLLAAFQNAIGVGLANVLGVNPLLGLLAGSVTMTGGHGTGAAFADLFEKEHGFVGALPVAMAAATFGLVAGGLIGSPIGTWLIKRNRLLAVSQSPSANAAASTTRSANRSSANAPVASVRLENAALDSEIDTEPAGEPTTAYKLMAMLTIILIAMWAGGLLSTWLGRFVTLPTYIGAMLVAAVIRNFADVTKIVRIDQRTIDDIGTIALSFFLTMALMSLKLWELLELAVPMIVILTVQVLFISVFTIFLTYRLMGRDYDAAVMAAGHCGFGMGATPNAVANMTSLAERFGPAPRAFLVVPMVGAFFIDLSNSMIITFFVDQLT